MLQRPLLIFPEPSNVSRHKKTQPVPSLHLPSPERQQQRLDPKLDRLKRSMERGRVALQSDPSGVEPEMVLVLETAGQNVEDFFKAVQRVDGLDWLGDCDEDDLPSDEDFYYEKGDRTRNLYGRLYLIMSDYRGMDELLSRWDLWKKDRGAFFRTKFAKWRDVFDSLKDIRRWGPEDRLEETGLQEDWQERVNEGYETVNVEIELWFRSTNRRQKAESEVRAQIEEEGGHVLGDPVWIEAIGYHALLAKLPIGAVEGLLNQNVKLVHCNQVMFFRPVGQVMVEIPDDESLDEEHPEGQRIEDTTPISNEVPIIALLDGLPLANHKHLANSVIVDDPDGWEQQYPVDERAHGTSMASLILHGDLDAGESILKRPIYVRPIMKPDSSDSINRSRAERIPEDVLPVDLVHRSVRRIFDGEGLEPATAPSVRVINVAIGDPNRPFYRFPSAWAKLLDWLSSEYKVLFIVSAGNHDEPMELDMSVESFNELKADPSLLKKEILKQINKNAIHRRPFSPAESVNALTVGALHSDSSPLSDSYLPNKAGLYSPIDLLSISPLEDVMLPSPINAQGPGFRRSIKPEILMPGGRLLYREKPTSNSQEVILEPVKTPRPPGQRVASPPKAPGGLTDTYYTRGTSNATALATRNAARLYEVIQQLRDEPGGDRLDDDYIAVLLKALLVHSTSWGDIRESLVDALEKNEKATLARLLGYGRANVDRVLFCTDQRATLLSWGKLTDGEAHLYPLPLPPSLSGVRSRRRLVVTLAWLTPINPKHHAYKKADLWFEPYRPDQKLSDFQTILQVGRQEADWRAVRRGTAQHEVFEGEAASAFSDEEHISVQVNCRGNAGNLNGKYVPYALAITLEVAPGINLPIYEEIRARIRPVIEIAPSLSA